MTHFDDHGLGEEPNNLIGIGSLTGYRTLRWGQNMELIVRISAVIVQRIPPIALK